MTQALAFGVCLLAFLAAASATSRGPYCRQTQCDNYCPKGYKTNSYGCRTCECKDPCEDLPTCDKSCPDGFKKNGDGCDICMCEQPVCEQPKAVGPCEAAIRSWYYNKYTQQCEKFFYGGCQGNDNRFSSKAECEETCPIVPVCEQPKKAGPCKAAFPRYYFNEYTQQCEHFIYGGCQANGNNFESKDDCEETCPVVPVCEQPKKVGPCRALIPRWYYSEAHRQCKPFSYGGCQANSNNFETKADCEETCDVDPCASLPQCTKTCRHGYKKNSDGCDICECVDPCDSLPPCTKTCQYGYKKNSYGCDICQCVVRVPVDKPGSCPRLPPRTVGTCVERCSGDRSCPGDQKCCSNGCGHVCKNPATPTTPRPAPSCPRYITASSSAWRNPCYSDNDCRGRYRCCQIGYSRRKSCVPGYSVRGPAY